MCLKIRGPWASTNGPTIISNNASIFVNTGVASAIGNERLIIAGVRTNELRTWMDCALMAGGLVNTSRGLWDGPITLDTEGSVSWFEIRGPIDGTAGLVVFGGDGSEFLSCILDGPLPNTYAGATRVATGMLQLNKSAPDGAIPHDLYIGTNTVQLLAANQIADSATVDIQSGGLFDLNGHSETISRLTGNGSVNIGGATLDVGSGNGTSTFDGVISGAGYLEKLGSGTFTLTGTNTYTATNHIVTGTLAVNGYQPQSPVEVWTNGTLGGHGTVGSITAIGGVAPGPGTLTCSNLTFSSFGGLRVELRGITPGSYDQLNVRGTCHLGARRRPRGVCSLLQPGRPRGRPVRHHQQRRH